MCHLYRQSVNLPFKCKFWDGLSFLQIFSLTHFKFLRTEAILVAYSFVTCVAPCPICPLNVSFGRALGARPFHANPAGGYDTTETPFTPSTLSAGEAASITGRCTSIERQRFRCLQFLPGRCFGWFDAGEVVAVEVVMGFSPTR